MQRSLRIADHLSTSHNEGKLVSHSSGASTARRKLRREKEKLIKSLDCVRVFLKRETITLFIFKKFKTILVDRLNKLKYKRGEEKISEVAGA